MVESGIHWNCPNRVYANFYGNKDIKQTIYIPINCGALEASKLKKMGMTLCVSLPLLTDFFILFPLIFITVGDHWISLFLC